MIDIVAKLDEYTETQIRVFPCHTNRASSIGVECLRQLVYYRTNWKDARKPDVRLQRIFNLGNEVEKITILRLMNAGVQIIRTQEPLSFPEHQLTGHPDGVLVDPETKEEYPFDVKSMSPFVFVKINEESDLERFSWTKKYKAQLMVYMHAIGSKKGVLILVNKSTGEEKVMWIDYDGDYVQALFAKADEVNKHVAAGTLPERIGFCDECSEYCPFLTICIPDVVYDAPEFATDPELEAMIARWKEIKAVAKEADALEKEIKEERMKPLLAPGVVGDRKKIFIGSNEVSLSWISKKSYEVKAQSYWMIKLDGGGK